MKLNSQNTPFFVSTRPMDGRVAERIFFVVWTRPMIGRANEGTILLNLNIFLVLLINNFTITFLFK